MLRYKVTKSEAVGKRESNNSNKSQYSLTHEWKQKE